MQIISQVCIKNEGFTFFTIKTFEIWKQYHTNVDIIPLIEENSHIVELWPWYKVSAIE